VPVVSDNGVALLLSREAGAYEELAEDAITVNPYDVRATAAALNACVALGETAIMVQRPGLNLLNSSIACAISCLLLFWLIPRFGVMGAAVSTLVPQIAQGILRSIALRVVFGWKTSWRNIRPPVTITAIGLIPALLCRSTLSGIIGQIAAAAVFLAVFGSGWWYYYRLRKQT